MMYHLVLWLYFIYKIICLELIGYLIWKILYIVIVMYNLEQI
jgi:hypothetical protein